MGVHDQFQQDTRNHWDSFDRFFSDGFFKNRQDSFDEMARFPEQVREMLGETFREPFSHSWDSWYTNRFSAKAGRIEMETDSQKDAYVITLRIEDLKDHRLNLYIDEDGIRVEGDFTRVDEKKDLNGNTISRQESRQSIVKRFSIPEDADYERAAVKNKKNRMIITLPRRIRS